MICVLVSNITPVTRIVQVKCSNAKNILNFDFYSDNILVKFANPIFLTLFNSGGMESYTSWGGVTLKWPYGQNIRSNFHHMFSKQFWIVLLKKKLRSNSLDSLRPIGKIEFQQPVLCYCKKCIRGTVTKVYIHQMNILK